MTCKYTTLSFRDWARRQEKIRHTLSEHREKVPYSAGMSCRAVQLDVDDDVMFIILKHACKGTGMFVINSVCKGWKSLFDRHKTEFDSIIVARTRERFPLQATFFATTLCFRIPGTCTRPSFATSSLSYTLRLRNIPTETIQWNVFLRSLYLRKCS